MFVKVELGAQLVLELEWTLMAAGELGYIETT